MQHQGLYASRGSGPATIKHDSKTPPAASSDNGRPL